jgi:peroxiredoxin
VEAFMVFALVFSRIILAFVFSVAAIAKIRDLQGSRAALVVFGLPDFLAGTVAVILPLVELATAILLLPSATASLGALLSFGLLLIFTSLIVINMALGRRPACHCFGQFQSEPIGPSTLARNVALLSMSGLSLVGLHQNPSLSVWSPLSFLLHDHLLITLVIATVVLATVFQLWLSVHLLRQNGRLLLRVEALEESSMNGRLEKVGTNSVDSRVGTSAPKFDLPSVDTENISLESLLKLGKPILLLFSDPGCGPCRTLMPDVAKWSREYAEKLTIALVSRGGVRPNRVYVNRHGLKHVLLQKDRELAFAYHVVGTPSALIVGADGLIHSGVASGAPAISELVGKAITGTLSLPRILQRLSPLPKNTVAPDFSLPDLAGRERTLAEFAGRSILLLFWNPSCGFCTKMLPELTLWERQNQNGVLDILVVSSGSIDENSAMNLQSPVLMDSNHRVMRLFGSNGTPSAVLIDGNGRVSSDLATGAPAISALVATITPPPVPGRQSSLWKMQAEAEAD